MQIVIKLEFRFGHEHFFAAAHVVIFPFVAFVAFSAFLFFIPEQLRQNK